MVGGIIVPARLGNFEVRATYPGLTVTPLSVEVVGTPWSQTPTVDPEVQKWAKIPGNMLSPEGRFSRWADGGPEILQFRVFAPEVLRRHPSVLGAGVANTEIHDRFGFVRSERDDQK